MFARCSLTSSCFPSSFFTFPPTTPSHKMWRITGYIFYEAACFASADAAAPRKRDPPQEEGNEEFRQYRSASPGLPSSCYPDHKSDSLPSFLFQTYAWLRAQGGDGGGVQKLTYSQRRSYIPATSLEHVIYIYALI